MQQIFKNAKKIPKKGIGKYRNYKTYKLEDSNLILYGSKVGTISMRFSINYEPFIQQKSMGVMTEEGIKMFSPILQKGPGKNASMQASLLKSKIKQLAELMMQFDCEQSDYEQSLKTKELRTMIKSLSSILSAGEEKTDLDIQYTQIDEVVRMQNILLDVAEVFLEMHNKVDKSVEQDFFKCFEVLTKRREFLLQSFLLPGKGKSQIAEQMHVAIRYQRFIYDFVNLNFDCLSEKALSVYHKSFTEYGFVFSYFRVSEVREMFLSALSNGEYKIKQERQPDRVNIFTNWNIFLFSKFPETDSRVQENKVLLRKALEKPWILNLKSKTVFFYNFLRELIEAVLWRIPELQNAWEEIPGYEILMTNFFGKLKSKPIDQCSEIMISTSLVVVKNTKLLNKFMLVLIDKVSIKNHNLDKSEVTALFNFLNRIFQKLKNENIKIAASINIHIVINLLIGLVHCDNVHGILNAIYFMAKFGNCFSEEIVCNFTKMLMKFYFFKLALHWNETVRNYFIQFLCQNVIIPYEKTGKPELEKMVWRINQNLNFMFYAKDDYAQRRLKWENSSKVFRVSHSFEKLKMLVARDSHSLDFTQNKKKNFFPLSDRFRETFNKNFDFGMGSKMIINSPGLQQALMSDKTIKKVYNYQNLLREKKETRIKPNHLSYLKYSLEQFENMVIVYYNDKTSGGEIFGNEMNSAEVKLIVDRFELKED